ncbi:MAG: hypothetical protein D8H93_10590 [Capnocytophaga sp.]|nr:MAG: hypothetical protein D8H93_10590 [Capnocytophaga sp.]
MKIKYLAILVAFVGIITHCFPQYKDNFLGVYDSNALFKVKGQVSNSAYARYIRHFYLVTKAEEGHKRYPLVPKSEIVQGMDSVIPESFNSEYIQNFRKASTKEKFIELLQESMGLEESDYHLEACYGMGKAKNLRYFEVVNTMSSSGYAEEYPFELREGKLTPLEYMERISDIIEKAMSYRLRKPVSRSMSSKYGAYIKNNKEHILLSYCSKEDNCPGYEFDIAVAYDPDTGNTYYARGNFAGEKTSLSGVSSWEYLGIIPKELRINELNVIEK